MHHEEARYGVECQRVDASGASNPVSLDLAKSYLEVDYPDKDEVIRLLLDAALDKVETDCGISITPKTITLQAEYWVGVHKLPYGPVRSIESVTTLPDNVLVSTNGLTPINARAPYGLMAVYTAGMTTVPYALKLAILKEAATQFEVRENIAIGTISSKIPGTYESYIAAYRQTV